MCYISNNTKFCACQVEYNMIFFFLTLLCILNYLIYILSVFKLNLEIFAIKKKVQILKFKVHTYNIQLKSFCSDISLHRNLLFILLTKQTKKRHKTSTNHIKVRCTLVLEFEHTFVWQMTFYNCTHSNCVKFTCYYGCVFLLLLQGEKMKHSAYFTVDLEN